MPRDGGCIPSNDRHGGTEPWVFETRLMSASSSSSALAETICRSQLSSMGLAPTMSFGQVRSLRSTRRSISTVDMGRHRQRTGDRCSLGDIMDYDWKRNTSIKLRYCGEGSLQNLDTVCGPVGRKPLHEGV